MRIIAAATTACVLVGCGGTSGMEGSWSGGCSLQDDAWPEAVAVSLKVEQDNGNEIIGTGSFSIPEGGEHGMDASTWSAEIDGSHVGEQVDIALNAQPEFGYESVEMRLEIAAEIDEDRIDGDCTLAGVIGVLQLRR